MSASDWINLSIALIAGIAAILTMVNINVMVKENEKQKKQWEFSYVPAFKIVHTTAVDASECILIIQNENNTYYQIDSISFSRKNVSVSFQNHGEVRVHETDIETRKYEGLQVNLEPEDYMGLVGHFILEGKDALGNKFSLKSKEIHFDHFDSEQGIDTTNTYLTKI